MSDQITIANRALSDAGTRSNIASFSEGSPESNAISLLYDSTRQQLLSAAHWGMAAATATLSLLKSAPGTTETPAFPVSGVWSTAYPPPGWLFSYAYPPDCLRGRKLIANYLLSSTAGVAIFPGALAGQGSAFTTSPGQKFTVATDFDQAGNQIAVILANTDQAIFNYTRDITNVSLWGAQFEEAMVKALAGTLCWALSGDKQRSNMLLKLANDKIMVARAGDGNEGLTVMNRDADWIQAHGAAYSGPWNGGGWFYPYGDLFTVV